MENILLKKSFQDIYGNIYALYEYIIVWCSIQKICKYISKNTVNLELIRGAMDCWRDEKKKKNRRMLVLEWKVWHPLRYLLTVVFMNKRSEAKRSLKLHFERHPLLFSSWPFLAWIFGMREEDRRGHVCVFTLERQEEERTGGEGKWKKKKERRIRKEIAKDASLFDPLGTYSLERVALCRLYTVTPLFSHTDAHSFCLLAIRVSPSAPRHSASFTRLRSRSCFLRIVFDSCFLRNNRSI